MFRKRAYPIPSASPAPPKPPKKRGPVRDNSRNIAVRMTEEQYQRLQRYMNLTYHGITLYFRKLIQGKRITGNARELERTMHNGVNMIHSNVQQIAYCQRAKDLDAESVQKLLCLADKLCEEVFLLSCQK